MNYILLIFFPTIKNVNTRLGLWDAPNQMDMSLSQMHPVGRDAGAQPQSRACYTVAGVSYPSEE